MGTNTVGGLEISTFVSDVDGMGIYYRAWRPPAG
ncbi:Uncharacterised protein [Mycobacteroides abscessus subsp. bolletii]|nr:Uncharacterised protein [Mycobacteroides abscessus subsp. bolletii]SKP68167.1 Uncharacterised protein [Mycobacteroides abscessus subsp. bolletii]SKP69033.1 Uncharacterised protein [Mycobacteroides abscessus subsp. bolletii]SKQ27730.1 Uncharacterised protein [Mycobacteroides abscessus subsp. bolletii]